LTTWVPLKTYCNKNNLVNRTQKLTRKQYLDQNSRETNGTPTPALREKMPWRLLRPKSLWAGQPNLGSETCPKRAMRLESSEFQLLGTISVETLRRVSQILRITVMNPIVLNSFSHKSTNLWDLTKMISINSGLKKKFYY